MSFRPSLAHFRRDSDEFSGGLSPRDRHRLVNTLKSWLPEKDEQVRKIRQEVEEMVNMWIPFMNYKVENLTASSNYFRESGPVEKEDLIRKHSMDDALEDKICDLYELYAERIEKNSGLQVKVLYEELAALWPSGFMDTHGIRYAKYRAKERRRLLRNLMKDQDNIKQKQTVLAQKSEDSSRAVATNVLRHSSILEINTEERWFMLLPPCTLPAQTSIKKKWSREAPAAV